MVKSFEVVYDDFSGGHFVGQVGTHQPMNTFTGYNIGPDPTDGTLCPLADFFAATNSLSSLDATSTCTKVLHVNLTGLASPYSALVWAGSTHCYECFYGGTIGSPMSTPIAVQSVAIASAAMVNSAPAYFPPTDRVLILGSNGTSLFNINISSGTPVVAATGTIPAACVEMIVWGEFVFADTGTGKLYFSNPSTAATWTSTDWIAIPITNGVNAQTQHMVVHQGNLWIATPAGWFVASGIPNSTLSLRQATAVATGSLPVSIDTSIVSTGELCTVLPNQDQPPLGPMFRELVGNRDRGLNYASGAGQRYPEPMVDLSRFGNYIVAVDDGSAQATDEGGATIPASNTIWVLDARTGVWTRRLIAYPGATPVLGLSLQSQADLLVYRRPGVPTDSLQIAWLGQPGLLPNQDHTYQTATADLAEYYHRTPFTIKEILCEVDYGRAPRIDPTLSQERTISVSVKTPGVPIEYGQDLSEARAVSSTLTHTLPSFGQTGANFTTRRSWVRFNPTDASTTYTATPVVTLSGCKLRRLVMRCVEVE